MAKVIDRKEITGAEKIVFKMQLFCWGACAYGALSSALQIASLAAGGVFDEFMWMNIALFAFNGFAAQMSYRQTVKGCTLNRVYIQE